MHFIHLQVAFLLFSLQRWNVVLAFFLELLSWAFSLEISMSFCFSLVTALERNNPDLIHGEVFLPLSNMSSLDCYHCSMAQTKTTLPLKQLVKRN